jgi:hypothetical protein
MNGELFDDGKPEQIGTITHELGHQLCRLPDLYDVSSTNAGLGSFSLMDAGCVGTKKGGIPGSSPVNLDAWSRQYLGWEKPKQPKKGSVTFTTPALGNGESSVKLLMGGHRTTEYFLAEVRDLSGWDEGLEGFFDTEETPIPANFKGGLLIIHVDEAIGSGSMEEDNDINNAETTLHQGVMAVDARYPKSRLGKESTPYSLWWGDNPEIDEEARNGAVEGTVDFKTPDSNFYGNIPTDISITGIGAPEGGKLTATVTGKSGGGCNSGFAMIALAAVLLVMGWRTPRGTRCSKTKPPAKNL